MRLLRNKWTLYVVCGPNGATHAHGADTPGERTWRTMRNEAVRLVMQLTDQLIILNGA